MVGSADGLTRAAACAEARSAVLWGATRLPQGCPTHSRKGAHRYLSLGLSLCLSLSLSAQGDGRKLDAALGTVAPADVAHPSDPTSAVVLRRPQLAMAADWALTFQL